MKGVNRNMNIMFVLTYVVKYENRTEFQALVKRFLKLKKENPKIFDGLKSWRLFQREYGGVAGSYVEMWEFKSARVYLPKNVELGTVNRTLFYSYLPAEFL